MNTGFTLVRRLAVVILAVSLCGCGHKSTDLMPSVDDLSGKPQWVIGPILSLCTLVSEDLACVASGVLVHRQVIGFGWAVFWCWVGILGGDIALYIIGRTLGKRACERWPLKKFLSPSRLRHGEEVFRRMGGWLLFSSRFLPGTRVPAYVAAGVVRYPIWKFSLFLAIAGGLWTPVIVGFARFAGERVTDWLGVYGKFAWLGVALTIVLVWMSVELILPLFSHRGRRLLLARWYRLVEWEFWPSWAFYPPILAYVFVWLHFKFKGLAFLSSNPGIPHSGMALESKSQILRGLGGPDGQDRRIARWAVIGADLSLDEKMAALDQFLANYHLTLPVVLKPDIGERGQGVGIIRDHDSARAYLETCPEEVIIQEYVPGLEFGVFYYRYPGAEKGEIYSITSKQLISLTGNGVQNLERLILDDPRAVRMAQFFFKLHDSRLDWVPAKGQVVFLTDLGTHCRGALFTDAREHITEALRAEIDALSQQFEGFYFGRYDLRVPDLESLREGKGIKVLELNGVSSEATHIYQPKYKLSRAYRDMARQWRIAYEIGAANIRKGAPPVSWSEFMELARAHRARKWFEAPR